VVSRGSDSGHGFKRAKVLELKALKITGKLATTYIA